ncbi:extracellular catalytic domain type 1 short-chain-length polyhydroxyalkanoate depolymerase [Azohydromonas caseinilytica]|uniref:PHB depolymerase family esterase n=1 Tax=Azohydromonas caseinilytica TaxID=2728836 RepID=A0A848FBH2_9BURK|nr:PHB depolymerase family esterase [Azohydromonas caseinilytica]NML15311.1 PHB depolymerase family esterase [Azohydromonas caseinilytica]
MRYMNGRRCVAAAVLALASGWAAAGTSSSFDFGPQSYAGSQLRRVQVYLPDGLSGPAPMVMALHGCQQTEQNVLQDWGLRAAADRYGFVLVTPFITRYDGLRNANCWGFWLDQHRHQGRGEVEDLHRIAQEVERRWSIDPRRRYITGLSSGGAMTVVASVAHNEYWAAAASASGLGYGEDAASVSFSGCPGSATFHSVDRLASDMRAERDSSYPIPLMVLQNRQDCTVLARAGELLRDAQLKSFGDAAHDTPAEALAEEKACSPVFGPDYGCKHSRYTADAKPGSRSLVETIFYSGPIATPSTGDTDHGHYWIGGEQGLDGNWSLRQGPSYPDIVWNFFARHPRADGGNPPPPPPDVDCTGTAASPSAHVSATRAVQGGLFNLRALATADQRDIGFAYDSWSSVRLYQVGAGRWQLDRPASCGN